MSRGGSHEVEFKQRSSCERWLGSLMRLWPQRSPPATGKWCGS